MPKLHKADLKAEREGVWLVYQGIRFRIGRRNTKEYLQRRAEALEPIRHKAMRGNVDPDEVDAITAQILGELVVLDWEDLEDDDGKSLDYSSEKAAELLSDPENHPWRAWVEEQSGRDELYRKQSLEIAKGN